MRVRQRTQENANEDDRPVWADAQNHIKCHVKCTWSLSSLWLAEVKFSTPVIKDTGTLLLQHHIFFTCEKSYNFKFMSTTIQNPKKNILNS